MEDGEGTGGVYHLVFKADKIRRRHAAAIDAHRLFDAGVGGLVVAVRHLDLGHDPALLFHGAELVHSAERGVGKAGNELGAYAVDVYLRILRIESEQHVLVYVVGGEYLAVGVTRRVQHLACLAAEIGKVAAVQPDADGLVPFRFQAVEDLYRIGDAALQGVVGVHEKEAIVGIYLGIRLKRLELGGEGHHPAVGVRARHRDAEHLPRKHVGRGAAAADICCTRAVSAGVRPLRTTEPELQYLRVRARGEPRRSGGDERLMIDDGKERRLDDLRLEDGRRHREDGLGREDHRPFRYSFKVARETEGFEPRKEVFRENAQRPQISDVFLLEAQVAKILHRLFQSRRHGVGIAAAAAVKEVEHRPLFAHSLLEIAVCHSELIEVGEHGEIALTGEWRDHFFSSAAGGALFSKQCFGSFHGVLVFLM